MLLIRTIASSFARYIEMVETNLLFYSLFLNIFQGFILCFHSLENVFVRFHTSTIPYLNQLVGICKSFMLFGVPGYTVNIQSISPSSVPFMEPAMKNELNITPKLRKKKPPKNNSKNRKINLKKIEPQPEHGECASYYDSNIKTWKTTAMNSSDSELSDSEGENLIRQREYQAKVRAAALKALTAAFKVNTSPYSIILSMKNLYLSILI